MHEGRLNHSSQRNAMPWKPVSAFAAVVALLLAAVWIWMRRDETNCDWECFNFPAFVLVLVLAGLFLICVLSLAVMLGIWLWRERKHVDNDSVGG